MNTQNCEKQLLASVCLSAHSPVVPTEQFGYHWKDLNEIRYMNIFRN